MEELQQRQAESGSQWRSQDLLSGCALNQSAGTPSPRPRIRRTGRRLAEHILNSSRLCSAGRVLSPPRVALPCRAALLRCCSVPEAAAFSGLCLQEKEAALHATTPAVPQALVGMTVACKKKFHVITAALHTGSSHGL